MKSRVSFLLSLLLLVGCEPDKRPATSTQPTTKPWPTARPDTLTSTNPQAAADTMEPGNRTEQLRQIRTRVGQLNGLRRWTKVVKRDLYNSTEGGEAQYYYQNGRVAKIVAHNYGEMGQGLAEYYLWPDGQLAFVFERDINYRRPFGYDSVQVKTDGYVMLDSGKPRLDETRSYFHHSQLIQQLTDSVRSEAAAAKRRSAEQKRLQADLMDLLHTLKQPQ